MYYISSIYLEIWVSEFGAVYGEQKKDFVHMTKALCKLRNLRSFPLRSRDVDQC